MEMSLNMKMKPDGYTQLQKIAQFSFEECYAGLNLLLYTDKNFSKFMERNYRLKQYYEEGDFFMTANERNFHLIGFINAIIYLERKGLIFENHPRRRLGNPLSDDSPELDILKRIITIVECGDDITEKS